MNRPDGVSPEAVCAVLAGLVAFRFLPLNQKRVMLYPESRARSPIQLDLFDSQRQRITEDPRRTL